MSIRRAAILGLLCLSVAATAVQASGGYSGVVIPPGAVDRQQFELGRQLFAGTATLGEVDTAAQAVQQPVLQAWQEQLPGSQKKKIDLPSFAGKLTPEQLGALGHYINVRFRIPTG